MKFDVQVEFVPEKFYHIVSRAHFPFILETTDSDKEVLLMIYKVCLNLSMTPDKLTEI